MAQVTGAPASHVGDTWILFFWHPPTGDPGWLSHSCSATEGQKTQSVQPVPGARWQPAPGLWPSRTSRDVSVDYESLGHSMLGGRSPKLAKT